MTRVAQQRANHLNAILAGRRGDVIANMQKGSNPSFREPLTNYRGGHEHSHKPIFDVAHLGHVEITAINSTKALIFSRVFMV